LWDYQDSSEKLNQWTTVKNTLNDEYKQLIQTKQELIQEFDTIMYSKSINKYKIINKNLIYKNNEKLLNIKKRNNV
jgi:hypothetical protein